MVYAQKEQQSEPAVWFWGKTFDSFLDMNLRLIFCVLLTTTFGSSLAASPVRYAGNFAYFQEVPNTLFLIGEVKADVELEFRTAVKRHDVKNLVLMSFGGSVIGGLEIASIVHDKGINTYVPAKRSYSEALLREIEPEYGCMSACSFIFFAGKEKKAEGPVGVHQFYSQTDEVAKTSEVEQYSQRLISRIISTLNTFEVPAEIFEYMFESKTMFFLTDRQLSLLGPERDKTFHRQAEQLIDDLVEALENQITADQESDHVEDQVSEPESAPDQKFKWFTLQSNLKLHGCEPGALDGIPGKQTYAAITRFKIASEAADARSLFSLDDLIRVTLEAPAPACSGVAIVEVSEEVPSHQVDGTKVPCRLTFSGGVYLAKDRSSCQRAGGKITKEYVEYCTDDQYYKYILRPGECRAYGMSRDNVGRSSNPLRSHGIRERRKPNWRNGPVYDYGGRIPCRTNTNSHYYLAQSEERCTLTGSMPGWYAEGCRLDGIGRMVWKAPGSCGALGLQVTSVMPPDKIE